GVAVHPVGPDAPAEPDLARLRRALRPGALVRLESGVLSAGHDLVLQPICMAADVRVRGLVWRRRRHQAVAADPLPPGTGRVRGLDGLRLRDRDDLAYPGPRSTDPEMDDQGDLSDRQDRSRHAALHPFPRARGR